MRAEAPVLSYALYKTNTIAKLGRTNLIQPRSVLYLRKKSPSSLSQTLFAEIAPLPGFSVETIESSLQILKSQPMPEHLPPAVAWGMGNFFVADVFPFAKAFADWSWLIPRGEPAAQMDMLRALIEKKVSTVKIKTEQESLQLLLDYLAQTELPDSFAIRLDANNEFSAAAVSVLRRFTKKSVIEFIEDPFPSLNLDLWRELSTDFALATNTIPAPVARKNFFLDRRIAFVSLKPSLVGDEKKIIELSREFRSYGLKVIYSSLMETDIGALAINNLCTRYPGDAKPGLGVSHLFQPVFSSSLLLDFQALDWQELR